MHSNASPPISPLPAPVLSLTRGSSGRVGRARACVSRDLRGPPTPLSVSSSVPRPLPTAPERPTRAGAGSLVGPRAAVGRLGQASACVSRTRGGVPTLLSPTLALCLRPLYSHGGRTRVTGTRAERPPGNRMCNKARDHLRLFKRAAPPRYGVPTLSPSTAPYPAHTLQIPRLSGHALWRA